MILDFAALEAGITVVLSGGGNMSRVGVKEWTRHRVLLLLAARGRGPSGWSTSRTSPPPGDIHEQSAPVTS
eukprot:7917742-Heterocapsa_arctica.AAC.1